MSNLSDKLSTAWQVAKLTALVAVVGIVLSLHAKVAQALDSWRLAGDAARQAAAEVSEAARIYNAQLTSAKNLKALDATIALGATAQGTLRLFNTTTLPRVNDNLDELRNVTQGLQAASWELKAAIAVNGGHLSEILVETKGAAAEFQGVASGLRKVADEAGVALPEIAAEFRRLIASGDVTAEKINALLSDPNLPALVAQAVRLLDNGNEIAVNVNGVAVNLEKTTAELPPIVKRAGRWQNPINAARLVSILVGLF